MFEPARYFSSNLTVGFPRRADIEGYADAIAARLEGRYEPYPMQPLPEWLEQDVPRLAFVTPKPVTASHRIYVTQAGFRLEVFHKPSEQLEPSVVEEGLIAEVALLFGLLDTVQAESPTYCGLITHVRVPAESGAEDRDIGRYLAKRFLREPEIKGLYELTVRFCETIDERFFSNTTYEVYRSWDSAKMDTAKPRLSGPGAMMRGMLITGDFNDRHAFNENEEYTSDQRTAEDIVRRGMDAVNQAIKTIGG